MNQTIDPGRVAALLIDLRTEHRDLDEAISQMTMSADSDELQLKRMKKRKLKLKDMISYYENQLIPDLDA
jgi:hypothetical protein